MADHPNVELLRRAYAAYAAGELGVFADVFADDIVWHVTGRSPLAGEYRGREQVFGFFRKVADLSEGTARIDVHDILANDDHAVALVTQTATRSGKELNGLDVHTFHVRGGRVVEFWDSPIDRYASDEFWSST